MYELFRDLVRQLEAVLSGDQVQHHVEGGGATGAGETVPVDFEQVRGHVDFGKLFGEAAEIFPMDGAAPVFQQPGPGQDMGAGADRADGRPLAGQPAQGAEHTVILVVLGIDPGGDDDGVRIGQVIEGSDRIHLDAVAGLYGIAVLAQHAPVIQRLSGHAVGRAQGLYGSGKGKQRKVRRQKEIDGERDVIWVVEHIWPYSPPNGFWFFSSPVILSGKG